MFEPHKRYGKMLLQIISPSTEVVGALMLEPQELEKWQKVLTMNGASLSHQ